MAPAFTNFVIDTTASPIAGCIGGDGDPVLLLHGIPETHLMWQHVAPGLAERWTVVATDLRGFGRSGTRGRAGVDAPFSMRELARDQLEVMTALGFDTFAVIGHDRGARCAYRLAIDSPDRVSKLGVLDIIPTGDAFVRADKAFALGYWVWTFLAAPSPTPEQLILGAPDAFVNHALDTWSATTAAFSDDLRQHYITTFRDPDRVHAICEQYRAAATIDVEHDHHDRGTKPITAPTLALWSALGAVAQWYDPLAIWREWAPRAQGGPINAGHFLAEEAPAELTERLISFLS